MVILFNNKGSHSDDNDTDGQYRDLNEEELKKLKYKRNET
jgi:hypothetical protein